MTQITLSNIVTLVNGIIQHGNHGHNEHTPEEFAELQKIADRGQIEDHDQELLDLYEEICHNGSEDFTIDFDGNEYRIIKDDIIWSIYVETIKETVLDCYGLDKIPGFVEIDWEQTAKNCYYDGYGYTFATYDNEESEAGGFWIFRTN